MKDFYLQNKLLVAGSVGSQVVNLSIQTILFPQLMAKLFINFNEPERIRRNINKLAGIWLLKQSIVAGRQTINMHFDYELTRFITDEFMSMLFRKYEFAYTEINTPLVLARMNMIRSHTNSVLSRIYISLLPRVVTSAIVLVSFLKIDLRIGLTILASSILYVTMVFRSFDLMVTKNIDRMISFYEKTISSIDDKFSNIETIVLTPNATEYEIGENRKRTDSVVRFGIRKDKYKMKQDNKLVLLNIVLLFAILQAVQTEYARGKITSETVSKLILMINNMNDQMADISYFIPEVMTHLAYIEKHAAYIDELFRFRAANDPSSGCVEARAAASAIRFERVSFAYNDQVPVIDDLTFDIPIKKILCLYGVSGVGKSTITKLMLGSIVPQSGNIIIHGTNVSDMTKRQRRSILKYIPQNTNVLFNDTIYNNIIYGLTDSQKIRKTVSDIFAKYDLVSMYDNVGTGSSAKRMGADRFAFLDFVVGRNGGLVSGGQRQMIHIVRCMLNVSLQRSPTLQQSGGDRTSSAKCATDSSIIILDEPTTALDNDSKRNVLRLLRDINAMNVSIIIISHDEEVQEFCHSALVVYRDQTGIRIDTKSKI